MGHKRNRRQESQKQLLGTIHSDLTITVKREEHCGAPATCDNPQCRRMIGDRSQVISVYRTGTEAVVARFHGDKPECVAGVVACHEAVNGQPVSQIRRDKDPMSGWSKIRWSLLPEALAVSCS